MNGACHLANSSGEGGFAVVDVADGTDVQVRFVALKSGHASHGGATWRRPQVKKKGHCDRRAIEKCYLECSRCDSNFMNT